MSSGEGAAAAGRPLQCDDVSYGTTSNPKDEGAPSNRWNLWRLVGFLCLAVSAEGYDIGVLNGALVRIQDDLDLGSIQAAIIVSMAPLFVIPGSLLAGWAADTCGRLQAIGMTTFFLAAGPLIAALANGFVMLALGRGVAGLGIGFGYVVVSMYVSEVAPANQRGQLVSFMEVALNMGMLLGYAVNFALLGIENDWRIMLGLGSTLTVVLAVFVVWGFVPESPRWLFLHERWEDGRAVLTRFVGESEANDIVEAWTMGPSRETVSWRMVLWPWENRRLTRQLAAGLTVAVSQTACGYLAVAYYSSKVMKRVMDERTAFLNTMIMGVIKTVVAVGVVLSLEGASRRTMLLASPLVAGGGCVLVAKAFTLAWGPWALAAGFWLFMAGFSLGLGPVTFVYLAEVFPTEFRGKAMGFALCVSRMVAVATTFLFPLATDGLGVPTTFIIMACINVALMALIWLCVIEVSKTSEPGRQGTFCRTMT